MRIQPAGQLTFIIVFREQNMKSSANLMFYRECECSILDKYLLFQFSCGLKKISEASNVYHLWTFIQNEMKQACKVFKQEHEKWEMKIAAAAAIDLRILEGPLYF